MIASIERQQSSYRITVSILRKLGIFRCDVSKPSWKTPNPIAETIVMISLRLWGGLYCGSR
jgi:hypothetical protein